MLSSSSCLFIMKPRSTCACPCERIWTIWNSFLRDLNWSFDPINLKKKKLSSQSVSFWNAKNLSLFSFTRVPIKWENSNLAWSATEGLIFLYSTNFVRNYQNMSSFVSEHSTTYDADKHFKHLEETDTNAEYEGNHIKDQTNNSS